MHDCRKTLPLTFCYIQSNQFLLCMQLQSEYYLHESIVMQLLTREHFFRIVKYLPCIFKANARWRARWTTTLLKKKHCVKVPCLFGQHIENHHQRHGNKKKVVERLTTLLMSTAAFRSRMSECLTQSGTKSS